MNRYISLDYAHILNYIALPINVQVQYSAIHSDLQYPQVIIIPSPGGLSYCFTPHTHDAVELIYILEGSMILSIGENRYTAHPGELYIANPYEIHSAYLTEETPTVRYVYITAPLHELCFSPDTQIQELTTDLLEARRHCRNFCRDSQISAAIGSRMLEMAHVYPNQKNTGEAECILLGEMYRILAALIGASVITATNGSEQKAILFVRKVSQFLEDHYMHEITPQMLTEQFSYHPDYFSRLFSKLFGIPFRTYLTEYRISRAMELFLRSEETSVHEIAAKVGFSDYCYFSHMFKKHVGISPTEYLKSKHT